MEFGTVAVYVQNAKLANFIMHLISKLYEIANRNYEPVLKNLLIHVLSSDTVHLKGFVQALVWKNYEFQFLLHSIHSFGLIISYGPGQWGMVTYITVSSINT